MTAMLPPPPNLGGVTQQKRSSYAETIAKSMTIEEMRQLHQRALNEAEAKQTELRLVLASRYRELVGSSDEVTRMRERAQELHELVHALPLLMKKLIQSTKQPEQESKQADGDDESTTEMAINARAESSALLVLRRDFSILPRVVHRALDSNNVHQATASLLILFRLIAEQTNEYPLATALSPGVICPPNKQLDAMLQAQMRMTYLHVQTLPAKISRISKQLLNRAASYGASIQDSSMGASMSAAALSTLDLLDIDPNRDRPVQLLDLYFDSKSKLLQSLLNQLSTSNKDESPQTTTSAADGGAHNAEAILSKIVLILQYDVIMHPYQMFVLRKFPVAAATSSSASSTTQSSDVDEIMKSLPMFLPEIVQSKSSNFLAAHLPLIRTKVKSVLYDIAGTTASALGKIRQSLYDKTDGLECMERLDSNRVCTWEQAVQGMVDVQMVSSAGGGGAAAVGPLAMDSHATSGSMAELPQQRKFSLWSVLFSNTFSSLVHSLLTTSFHSVHTRVASSLRLSLANAPPLSSLLPHEAYRNTLHIASGLDTALLKVSEDAHELLVHAEEHFESERRLRQSLYVQTCEIMGRMICELRRMLYGGAHETRTDAVKELIVGRLCHLLKFRLTALPTLLNPNSSPAVLLGTSGMISLLELQSAFELADDNDDGLITFEEAMAAVDSAFSGTQFHGAEMLRETLLLPSGADKDANAVGTTGTLKNTKSAVQQDVTLNELTLLAARGLRHEASGRHSALGTIQESLDDIIATCFQQWAKVALGPSAISLSSSIQEFVHVAASCTETEYKRMYAPTADGQSTLHQQQQALRSPNTVSSSDPMVGNVSPHMVGYLLEVSFILNRSICPSDSLLPVPSMEYATAMGIVSDDATEIPSMMDMIRWALLRESLDSVASVLDENVAGALSSLDADKIVSLTKSGPSGLLQLKNDLSFIQSCFFERNKHGFGRLSLAKDTDNSKASLTKLSRSTDTLVGRVCDATTLAQLEEKRKFVFEVCDLYLSSLFGEDAATAVPAVGDLGDLSFGGPTLRTGANPLLHTPLPSSCRFSLLPIQSDRTLSDIQLRGKYKDKDETENRQDAKGGGVMSSGLGFFSSMLKKN
jgi:hypothetical protein